MRFSTDASVRPRSRYLYDRVHNPPWTLGLCSIFHARYLHSGVVSVPKKSALGISPRAFRTRIVRDWRYSWLSSNRPSKNAPVGCHLHSPSNTRTVVGSSRSGLRVQRSAVAEIAARRSASLHPYWVGRLDLYPPTSSGSRFEHVQCMNMIPGTRRLPDGVNMIPGT